MTSQPPQPSSQTSPPASSPNAPEAAPPRGDTDNADEATEGPRELSRRTAAENAAADDSGFEVRPRVRTPEQIGHAMPTASMSASVFESSEFRLVDAPPPAEVSFADEQRHVQEAVEEVTNQSEWITLQLRWIGLAIGYALVNISPQGLAATSEYSPDQTVLNQLLTAGVVMMLVSTIFSVRGRPLLRGFPLVATALEAFIITMLCHFDRGLQSPFRFYYFIALVIVGLRYLPLVSWSAYAMHSGAYVSLIYIGRYVATVRESLAPTVAALETAVATVALMLWATYAANSIGHLLQTARRRLGETNVELRDVNGRLEDRIARRTRQLRESQAVLVQREKQAAFGLLAAGIAHEVGNPLAGISAVTQMLGRHLAKKDQLDDYSMDRLATVDEQLRRIQRTLRELTDFSRPGSPERVRTDIRSACESALQIAKYYARRKGKTIIEDYADDLPAVHTVRDELVQVVLNLVLNAMDATEEGGTITVQASRVAAPPEVETARAETSGRTPLGSSAGDAPTGEPPTGEAPNAGARADATIDASTAVSPAGRTTQGNSPQTDWVAIRVIDDGHGVPAQLQDSLFEPYFTSKEKGTGLGLFVSRKIATGSLQGTLELESSRPGETIFRLRVPSEVATPADSRHDLALLPQSEPPSP